MNIGCVRQLSDHIAKALDGLGYRVLARRFRKEVYLAKSKETARSVRLRYKGLVEEAQYECKKSIPGLDANPTVNLPDVHEAIASLKRTQFRDKESRILYQRIVLGIALGGDIPSLKNKWEQHLKTVLNERANGPANKTKRFAKGRIKQDPPEYVIRPHLIQALEFYELDDLVDRTKKMFYRDGLNKESIAENYKFVVCQARARLFKHQDFADIFTKDYPLDYKDVDLIEQHKASRSNAVKVLGDNFGKFIGPSAKINHMFYKAIMKIIFAEERGIEKAKIEFVHDHKKHTEATDKLLEAMFAKRTA